MTEWCRVCEEECVEKFRPCRCQWVVHPQCLQNQLKNQWDRSRCRDCQYQFQVQRRYRFIGWGRVFSNYLIMLLICLPIQFLIPAIWDFRVAFGFGLISSESGFDNRFLLTLCVINFMLYILLIAVLFSHIVAFDGIELDIRRGKITIGKFYLYFFAWCLIQVCFHALGISMIRILVKTNLISDHSFLQGLSFITYSLGTLIILGILVVCGIFYLLVVLLRMLYMDCSKKCFIQEEQMLPA